MKFFWNGVSIYMSSTAAFPLPWQGQVVITETIRLTTPKIFTICTFTEKVCCPLIW